MPRPPSNRTTEAPLLKYKTRRKNRSTFLVRCCVIVVIVLLILLLLAFVMVFVVIPLIFKYSVELQRDLVFPIYDLHPSDADYKNFSKYNLYGVRNLYVHVNKTDNILLGVWHLLPEAVVNNSIENSEFNYTELLAQSDYPVVLYFHGNGGNRAAGIEMYTVLRMFFHVIAFDYRSYGDSTKAILTEEGIVEDSVELYKWVRLQTDADIYLWGHSLGSSLCAHTTAKLKDDNIVPAGLILEAPFNTLRDEIEHVTSMLWFSRIFLWMPWYKTTMVNPFQENGLIFNTTEYMLKVDCPVMIIHAEDDQVVPISLSRKLYETATIFRNVTVQGNITFYPVPASFQLNHWHICTLPSLPKYIKDHIDVCEEYKNSNKLIE